MRVLACFNLVLDSRQVSSSFDRALTVQARYNMELCMNMHAELKCLNSEHLPYSLNIIRKKSLHSSCN